MGLISLLLGGLLLAGAAEAARPALQSVTVEARLEAGEPASVSMRYFLRPAGATTVALGSMHFGAARVANVRALLEDSEVEFHTEPASDGRVDGRVDLPIETRHADRVRLRLDYDVLPATAIDRPATILLPLLVASWAPLESLPETFRATVHLPAGVAVRSSFPTHIEHVVSIGNTERGSRHRFVLPVVPALLRLEIVTGPPAMLTAERAVDAVAAAILLLLAVYGLRRMREVLT